MRVELRTEARDDVFRAASFYDDQCEGLGDEFVETVFADIKTLERQAGVHLKIRDCHRKLTSRFPFAIYYKIDEAIIDVVAILD